MHDHNDIMTLPELRLAKSRLVDQQRKIQTYKVLQALQIDTQCVNAHNFHIIIIQFLTFDIS